MADLYCTKCNRRAQALLREVGRDRKGVLRVRAVTATCVCGNKQRLELENGRRVDRKTGEILP